MSKEAHISEPTKTLEDIKDVYDNKYEHLNVHQKVLLVRRSLSYMQKDTEGFGYKYTKESTILGAIKPMMDKIGLNLECDIDKAEDVLVSVYNKQAKKYSEQPGIRLHMTYTIRNVDKPDDIIVKKRIIQDAGSDVKTIGGLETYSHRYFLTKHFMIPNDKLDPDAHEKEVTSSTASKNIDSNQANTVKALLNNNKDAFQMLSKEYGISKITDITKNKYNEIAAALKLLNAKNKADKEKANGNI